MTMNLYTSTGTRSSIEKLNAMNVGLLMVNVWRDPSRWPFFAVDNGCYSSYSKQEEWNPAPFLNLLSRCKREGRKPDFIVIPDRVASPESLDFSLRWLPILETMYPRFPRYLAIQDGMTVEDTSPNIPLDRIQGLFIGGTMEWKMDNMKSWIDFAHDRGLQCHVGRIGPIQRMMICELAGADSIDSTTWVQRRDGVDKYVKGYRQQNMIDDFQEETI